MKLPLQEKGSANAMRRFSAEIQTIMQLVTESSKW